MVHLLYWGFIPNAKSQAPPRPTESKTLGVGCSYLCLTNPAGYGDSHGSSRNTVAVWIATTSYLLHSSLLVSTEQPVINHHVPTQPKTLQHTAPRINPKCLMGDTLADVAPCSPLCSYRSYSLPCLQPSSHTTSLYSWNTGRLFLFQGPPVPSARNTPPRSPLPPTSARLAPSCNPGLRINVTSTLRPRWRSTWRSFIVFTGMAICFDFVSCKLHESRKRVCLALSK